MKKLNLICIYIILLLLGCNESVLRNPSGYLHDSIEEDKSGSIEGEGDSSSGPIDGDFSEDAKAVNLQASKAFYPNMIKISWDPVAGADYYTLEKAEHDNEDDDITTLAWEELPQSIRTNHYDDDSTFLKGGKYYTYRVIPHTKEGGVGLPSETITGTILSSPTSINVSKGDDQELIEISWKQVPYVRKYDLYQNSGASESQLIAEVPADSEVSELKYSYTVPIDKRGEMINFNIVSLGPTNNTSPKSQGVEGYTFKQGAPVINSSSVKASRGTENDGVTIEFEMQSQSLDGEELTFVIYRSSEYETEFKLSDKAINAVEGVYSFKDDTAAPNTEYTYKIVAKNEIGSSKGVECKGYLLSYPRNVKLIPINEGNTKGYALSFDAPIGVAEDNLAFTYQITNYYKNGNQETSSLVTLDAIKNAIETKSDFADRQFSPIYIPYTKDNELNEISYAMVRTRFGNSYSKYVSSNEISLLVNVEKVELSQNKSPSKTDQANSNGVYPIYLNLANDGREILLVSRIGSDGSELQFTNDQKTVNGQYIDNQDTKPLVMYQYSYRTIDSFGRSLDTVLTTENSGYGAVTPYVFTKLFESLTLKPWDVQKYLTNDGSKAYWKNTEIAKKVEKGNAGDLSTQMDALTKKGEFIYADSFYNNGGRVGYMAKTAGIGGHIEFTYANFGENVNWRGNGSYSMDVDASGNGTCSSSGFTITGMYPGSIKLNKISVSKKNFTGSYSVTQQFSSGSLTSTVEVNNNDK